MSCAEAVDALAPWAGDLKPEDLSPLHLLCVFEKLINSESSSSSLSFPWESGQT